MGVEVVERYFALSERQREQFAALGELYREWNGRINVVSRQDIDELYVRHVLHSLAIAQVCRFEARARVCDVGSGGGFPAVPLAVMFPDAEFVAVDSITKKCRVTEEVAHGAGLDNIRVMNVRCENLTERFDYVVSRAVAPMRELTGWMWSKIDAGVRGSLPNGMLCLKGGDFAAELHEAGGKYVIYPISEIFEEPFFETKSVIFREKQK